jgi:hypothetical protein
MLHIQRQCRFFIRSSGSISHSCPIPERVYLSLIKNNDERFQKLLASLERHERRD